MNKRRQSWPTGLYDSVQPMANSRDCPIERAFTLVELLVVVTLITLAVSMITLGLDGINSKAKLRTACVRLGSIIELTRAKARISGQPRLVTYRQGRSSIAMQEPERFAGGWRWGKEREHELGFSVSKVLIEGETELAAEISVRIDGRLSGHVVVFESTDQWSALVVRPAKRAECRVIDSVTAPTSWDEMEGLLESCTDDIEH